MFGGDVGGGSSARRRNQIAPGAGLTTTSSGPRRGRAEPGRAPAPAVRRPPGKTTRHWRRTTRRRRTLANGTACDAAGSFLPGVRITADVTNNSLLIYANQENYRIIEQTLRQIDRPQLQIAIEATIAEVTLNDRLNYGVQFFLKSTNLRRAARYRLGHQQHRRRGARPRAARLQLPDRLGEPRRTSSSTRCTRVTDVKVLSNPSLVVLDNSVATLQVGDQVPFTTGTATVLTANNTVVNTIDYQNTGIILRVVPRINANGNVVLDIEQEISNVATPADRHADADDLAAPGARARSRSPTARPCCSPA